MRTSCSGYGRIKGEEEREAATCSDGWAGKQALQPNVSQREVKALVRNRRLTVVIAPTCNEAKDLNKSEANNARKNFVNN